MKVYANRTEMQLGVGATVADLVVAKGLPDRGIAIAVDGKVVPKAQWSVTPLCEGADVTIIRAVCGG